MLNRMINDLRGGTGSGATSRFNVTLYDSLMTILRKVKQPEELTLLRKAIDISCDAHKIGRAHV